jgi:hypothetical protein
VKGKRRILLVLCSFVVLVRSGGGEAWLSVHWPPHIYLAKIGSIRTAAVNVEVPDVAAKPYKFPSRLDCGLVFSRYQPVFRSDVNRDFLSGRKHSAVETIFLLIENGGLWRTFGAIPDLQFVTKVHEFSGSVSKVLEIEDSGVVAAVLKLGVEGVDSVYEHPAALNVHGDIGAVFGGNRGVGGSLRLLADLQQGDDSDYASDECKQRSRPYRQHLRFPYLVPIGLGVSSVLWGLFLWFGGVHFGYGVPWRDVWRRRCLLWREDGE